MKEQLRMISSGLIISCFSLLPVSASAAILGNPLKGGTDTAILSPGQIVARIVQTLLGFAGVLSIAIIIFAALKIVIGSAQGNDSMIGEGKKALLYAFIGLVVAFLGFILVNLLLQTLLGSLRAT